jgi:hypothetical protein
MIRFLSPLLMFPLTVFAELRVEETPRHLTIRHHDETVLTYHKVEMEPPKGASKQYRRSAFIHPLTAPNGAVLTSVHPKDHLHHVGLWHAWVNTEHKGRKLDFWNLGKGQATVRYRETQSISGPKGDGTAGFSVVQEHVVLPDEVLLRETLTIRVSRHADGHYLVDYETRQVNVSDAPLELPAYRYGGGLAYRGPLHWNKDNSTLLTSEGRSRQDGHATRARWCRFTGPTDRGGVSLLIMNHPDNHDAPQRQRIWPPDTHHGAPFYNLVPVQAKEWSLQPGKIHLMRYRLVSSDGRMSREKAESLWEEYTGEKELGKADRKSSLPGQRTCE